MLDLGHMVEPNLPVDSELFCQGLACGLGSLNGCLVEVGRSVNNKLFIFRAISFASSFICDIPLLPVFFFCLLLISLEDTASSSSMSVSCVPLDRSLGLP